MIINQMDRSPKKLAKKKNNLDHIKTSELHKLDIHPGLVRHSKPGTPSNKPRTPGTGLVSPFTPRTPSRLRISATSPLRISHSRGSPRPTSPLSPNSRPGSSPSSTSPLSRAGSSTFNSNSPDNNMLSETTRKLLYSPPSSPGQKNSTTTGMGHSLSSLLHISAEMSPSDPCLSTRTTTTTVRSMLLGPTSTSSATAAASPAKKLVPSPNFLQQHRQKMLSTAPSPKSSFPATKTTTSSPSKSATKQQQHIQQYFTTNKPIAKPTQSPPAAIDWNKPTLPLTGVEKNIDFHFDAQTCQPKIISNAAMERSKYTMMLCNQYRALSLEFMQQQETVVQIMSAEAQRVDRNKAQVVAMNMKQGNDQRNVLINDLNHDIVEGLKTLQKIEQERKSLEKICREQEACIRELMN